MNFRSNPLPLVLAAMPVEVRALLKNAVVESSSLQGTAAVHEIRLGTRRLRVGWTGIGPSRAEGAARWIAATFPTRWVLLTGYAGGTLGGHGTGLLLAAGEVRRSGAPSLLPDAALHQRMLEILEKSLEGDLRVHAGPFETVSQVAAGPEDKAALSAAGVCAVDMETHAAASGFAAAGIPWAALRVLLDPVRHSLAGVERLAGDDGKARPWRIAGALVREPLLLVRLARLALAKGAADRRLAFALDRIGRDLE